jgi:hypothetical protein
MFVDDTVMHRIDPARMLNVFLQVIFTGPVLQVLNDVRAKSSIALLFFLNQWLF